MAKKRTRRAAAKSPRKVIPELRSSLAQKQQQIEQLQTRERDRDTALRDFFELLRPFVEEVANKIAADAVSDHECFVHEGFVHEDK